MTSTAAHWQRVYDGRAPIELSWYQPRLSTSLALLDAHGLGPASSVLDAGGGASTLVDDLIARDAAKISVVDLSATALEHARRRLGVAAARVDFIVGDVLAIELEPAAWTHWHDRAVLHFLIEPEAVARYAAQLARALAPGGHAVIGGFAPDGPERCSGLPVARRDAAMIAAAMGPRFTQVDARKERHRTPRGQEQAFAWVVLRREQD